jgi:hypothetical protein
MGFDVGQAVKLAITIAVLGLVAWAIYTITQWYKDPSKRPQWVIMFLNIFSPVTYDKMPGYVPTANSTLNISTMYTFDPNSTTANACASNCSVNYSCNGIIFNSGNCYQVSNSFGSLIMIPEAGYDTYIRSSAVHPKWGFVSDTKDYAFATNPNLLSQHLGSPVNSTDPYTLSLNCIGQSTSNCAGFSTDSFMKQTWFVKDVSNNASTSNVSSYLLNTLTSANWKDAGF